MNTQSVKDRLKLLNSIEAETLYWKCQGLSDEGISNKTGDSKSQARILWTNALATVRPYGLGVELREAIESMAGNPPRFDPWPPEVIEELVTVEVEPEQTEPQEAEGVEGEVVEETETPDGSGPIVAPTETPARPQRNLRSFLLGIIILFAAGLLYSILRNPPVTTDTPTQIAEATTLPVATETPTTSEPPTIEPTAFPEAVILPNTPEPAATPTTDPQALFEDDFTGGMSDQWKLEYGNPLIVSDALNFTDSTGMVIGDSSWVNYIVSFDLSANTCYFNYDRGITVGVRYQDASNMMAFHINCDSGWSIVENASGRGVPNSGSGNPPASNGFMRIEITVNGNTYSVRGGPEFVYDGFSSGGVSITEVNSPYQVIDNFRVVALP